MYWTEQHNIILCREVVFENPYLYKKGSPQRSETWKKIVDVLNKCPPSQFNVDHRAIRDHINVLVNKYKKNIRADERASGISPDEPSELDEQIQQIIAIEESAPTDTCSKCQACYHEVTISIIGWNKTTRFLIQYGCRLIQYVTWCQK